MECGSYGTLDNDGLAPHGQGPWLKMMLVKDHKVDKQGQSSEPKNWKAFADLMNWGGTYLGGKKNIHFVKMT
ncbi:hypothetical protein C5167_016182 [Papaver somniferum]|nr:hypothetical protein C5167_016182 [Papaver somniferum]